MKITSQTVDAVNPEVIAIAKIVETSLELRTIGSRSADLILKNFIELDIGQLTFGILVDRGNSDVANGLTRNIFLLSVYKRFKPFF